MRTTLRKLSKPRSSPVHWRGEPVATFDRGGRTHVNRIAHLVAVGLMLSLPAAAHAATAASPALQRKGTQARKRRRDQRFLDFLRHPRHAQRQKIKRCPDGDGARGQPSPARFHDRTRKSTRPEEYFVVCKDAIGNGLTTSPSNSKLQPRMQFPKFVIRDMIKSQYRLLKDKFGIEHVVAVIGPLAAHPRRNEAETFYMNAREVLRP